VFYFGFLSTIDSNLILLELCRFLWLISLGFGVLQYFVSCTFLVLPYLLQNVPYRKVFEDPSLSSLPSLLLLARVLSKLRTMAALLSQRNVLFFPY